MSGTNRILAFDLLKGIGILLVILGHIEIPSPLKNIIYNFHMPLFFFVSGCFFKAVPLHFFLKKKWHQLLIPWLFFATILFLFLFVLNFYDTHSLTTALWTPTESVLSGLSGNENAYVLFHTIWFIICLLEVSVLYIVISKLPLSICKQIIINTLSLLFYVIGYLLNKKGINVPYFLDTALSAFIYYHLGHLFMQKQIYKKEMPVYMAGGGLLCAILLSVFLPVHVDLRSNEFPILLLPLSMLFTLSLYYLLKSFDKHTPDNARRKRFILWAGINSLALMGLHQPIIGLIFIIRNKLLLHNYIWSAIEFCIVTSLCCLATMFIKKYFPILLGVRINHGR